MDHTQSTLPTEYSSAINLSGTSAGLASSRPSSPSLNPTDSRGSFTRRRTSRGKVDIGQDPLNLATNELGQYSSGSGTTRRPAETGWGVDEDPFVSSVQEGNTFSDESPYGARYDNPTGIYSTAQPGPSSVSLMSFHESGELETDESREDDEARLTSNTSRPGTRDGWSMNEASDPERSAATAGSKTRSARYTGSPSPLKKAGTTLGTMSRNIRRVSLRVVNFSGMGLDDHVRLADIDDHVIPPPSSEKPHEPTDEDDLEEEEPLPDLAESLPLRGRTMGCFGPKSRVRLFMFHFLVHPLTEPLILLMIVFNAVVLTIQAASSTGLTSDDDSPPVIKGYFHSWEDYALFCLFILFTLEMFARICVSGFLLDPEMPLSFLFTSAFVSYPDSNIPASAIDSSMLSRHPSLTHSHSQGHIPLSDRKLTIFQWLHQFRLRLAQPFALAHHTTALSSSSMDPTASATASSMSRTSRNRSDTVQSKTPMIEKAMHHAQQAHSHIRNPSEPTFFSRALRSDNDDVLSLPFRLSVTAAHVHTQRNVPYLRHSWTRIDFVAIFSFWISFALAMMGVEHGKYHIGIFRALSVLRTARLLAITSGTTTIMRSLKTARPLLASVAYFVIFAMIMFSIIGIQSFEGSYRRTCHLLPTLGEDDIDLGQQCGAYIDNVTMEVVGFMGLDGLQNVAKGYVCPLGQICQEDDLNPESDIESFDTIYFAALQVVIVASANGWSPLMYNMMDAEFFVSCFFFIVCIIVLNFWLINLFVAVITNTFSAIRKDTKKSAFGAAALAPVIDESDDGWAVIDGRRISKTNRIKDIYENIRWCWVALALASLVLQATRTAEMSALHNSVLNQGELVLTIVFDIEIVVRVLAHLPDWRSFFKRGQNLLDLVLALGSSIIQIPAIHNSGVYSWLTILQLGRFYRVILEIPRMKPLLLAVFGNMYGLANMSLFLLLINFLAALVGVQLLRGDIPYGDTIDWSEIYNAFLGVYQVFSSENWTDVLYGAAMPEIALRQSAVAIIFVSGWMFFANFIVLQMFIAVINENFDVAEESKRSKQASHYWAAHRPEQARAPWVRKLNPYRWFGAKPKAVAVEQLPSNLVLPMQKSLIVDYGLPRADNRSGTGSIPRTMGRFRYYSTKSPINLLLRLFTGKGESDDVPLTTIRKPRRESAISKDTIDEETERHLEVLAALNNETAAVEDIDDIMGERRAQRADFIRDHPTYDKTFWLFSQRNPIRRFCQKLVAPTNGERIFGNPHSPIAHSMFQLLVLLAVIGGIVVEWIATPPYRRTYYGQFGLIRGSWFDIAETAFGLTLFAEFLIKITADGFLFTPNAYVRSIWNILDFFILLGILVNVTTGLIFIGGLSRFTRSLKALRALRLITLIDKMRSTFESLIISGASRILDAALLAILYMIPYAVWGLNIFAGLTNECNDDSVNGIGDCINEYTNNIIDDSFGYLVPRVWDNSAPSTTFSFDSFRASLLILFEIVSLEGWIDVMGVAMSITGAGNQPQTNASQVNAIFFIIYNLLGGVVILTLFVSIIIGNFTSKTGSALLTQPQREWIDLQKLIKRQRPSKRPKSRPTWRVRAWCFDRAVHKHGWWYTMMTGFFIIHVIVLMMQTFTSANVLDEFRRDFILFITFIYVVDILVRLFGLGWRSYSANGWNLFDIIVAGGSLLTTLIVRFHESGFVTEQLQKLFITSIAFKLVQRSNSLNKLFKTAVASLPVILSLLSLWLILFLFFAILYVEVFSLTKWNTAETRNQNYSTMSKALVMLAFMTTGEGWNQYMHDYALDYPRCTIASSTTSDSDCGSTGWAFSLFIAWNLLSMYIFANLFTGVVVESFYYVFQMTGGAKAITREEMRAFKKVWAEFADPETGYLKRDQFVPLFGKLTGIFEVRIYPAELSIPSVMARAKTTANSRKMVEDIDVDKLNAILNTTDRVNIKRRKNLYNRLYHEARISHEPGRGISFTNMLLLLAHHKLIMDREALVLHDLVIRTETNKVVSDLVDFDRVQSLLLMISRRRRYLLLRDQVRREHVNEQDIPAIVVDASPSTPPPIMTRDITSPGQHGLSRFMDPESPSPLRISHMPSPEMSFTFESPSSGLHRSRRLSDVSALSIDLTSRYSLDHISSGDSRHDEDGAENVLSSLQNSLWGEMMLEATQEDK